MAFRMFLNTITQLRTSSSTYYSDKLRILTRIYWPDSDFEEWTHSGDVFSRISSSCAEAPETCALARPNVTAEELEQSVLEPIETLVTLDITIFDYRGLNGPIAERPGGLSFA